MKKVAFSVILAISLCLCFSVSVFAQSLTPSDFDVSKILAKDLQEELATLASSDTIKIAVWIEDIDHDSIFSKLSDTNLTKESSKEQVDDYRNAKLDATFKAYKSKNSAFSTSALSSKSNINILYQSNVSPMFLLETTKSTVYELAKNPIVTRINLHEEQEEKADSNIANENSGVNFLQNTSPINATGDGVKIGMIEYGGIPNIDRVCNSTPVFDKSKMHKVDSGAYTEVNTHATLVAALLVGQSVVYNGVTYKGIAPDAHLYYTTYSNSTNFYTAIDKLILNKVNIINMSAGTYYTSSHAIYDNKCEWIDFLVKIEKIHFVKSSGNFNQNATTPNPSISSPGLAFNAITVGNYNDSNTLLTSHAPSTLNSQLLSSAFRINSSSCYKSGTTPHDTCKPELVAMGTSVAYANIYCDGSNVTNNNGTSFAAPQVAGMIAQLCDVYPVLKTKPFLVKAMLMSGAVYRLDPGSIYNDDDKDLYSEMFNKQGAGIANVRCAYTNYYAGRYREFSLSTSHSFTINVPSSYSYIRMAMCWDKNIYLGDGPQYDTEDNDGILEMPHKNFRLDVYYGTNTSGTPVASSNNPYSTCELLQFAVTQSGTYTVVITDLSPEIDTTHNVAISWY